MPEKDRKLFGGPGLYRKAEEQEISRKKRVQKLKKEQRSKQQSRDSNFQRMSGTRGLTREERKFQKELLLIAQMEEEERRKVRKMQ